MSKQKGTLCYAPLVQKIQEMDTAIKDLKLRKMTLLTYNYYKKRVMYFPNSARI